MIKCNCGQFFPEDKLTVRKYDAGYSEGECPFCGGVDTWGDSKQCVICGEWHSKDCYTAGCRVCPDCAAAEYTPERGREFLKWLSDGAVNGEAVFYFTYLPYFGDYISNYDALAIVKAGIEALQIDTSKELVRFCMTKLDEWTEFLDNTITIQARQRDTGEVA